MSLWRFEFYVEGPKNLEHVLESISEIALNMQPPQLVGNAEIKRGKIKAVNPGATGSYKEKVLTWARDLSPHTVFSSQEVKDQINKSGGSDTAYNHYIMAILDEKIATRRGRGQFVRL